MWKYFCMAAILSLIIAFLPILEEPLNKKIEMAIVMAVVLTISAGECGV